MKFVVLICWLLVSVVIEEAWGKLCQCSIQTGSMGCIGETAEFESCGECKSTSCGDISSSCYPGYSPGFQCWDDESNAMFEIEDKEYTVVEDDTCDQNICCCLVGDVTITKQGENFTIKSSIQGNKCTSKDVDNTFTSSMYGFSYTFIQNFNGMDTLIEGTKDSMFFSASNSKCSSSLVAKKGGKGKRGKTIGIAVGVVVGVVVIVAIIVVVIIRRRSTRKVPVEPINN